MRLHPAQLGNWRSVALFSLEQPLDLMGLTVLFGANGTGNTNILEAIAGLLDAVARPESLRDAIRVDRTPRDAGPYPGFLVVACDCWRCEYTADTPSLRALFNNR